MSEPTESNVDWEEQADTAPDENGPSLKTTLGLFFAVIAGIAMLALLLTVESTPPAAPNPLVGQSVGSFVLKSRLSDAPTIDAAELQGDVVLISFWATWCGPCRQEFPHLLELNKQFEGTPGYRFLAISTDDPNTPPSEIASFLAQFNADIDVYAEHPPQLGPRLAKIAAEHDMPFGIPLLLLVDRDGVIREAWIGFTASKADERMAEIDQRVRELLEK